MEDLGLYSPLSANRHCLIILKIFQKCVPLATAPFLPILDGKGFKIIIILKKQSFVDWTGVKQPELGLQQKVIHILSFNFPYSISYFTRSHFEERGGAENSMKGCVRGTL